jgi:hypothetical protein
VSEVLADPSAERERRVGSRHHVGRPGLVDEAGSHRPHQVDRALGLRPVAFGRSSELAQRLGERRVLGRRQIVVDLKRRRVTHGVVERDRRSDLAERRDRDPVVILEHFEVLDVVPEPVAEGPHAHPGWIGDQAERGAFLAAARERTQAQFRVRLKDAIRVHEGGCVLYLDQHCALLIVVAASGRRGRA